MKKYRRGQKLYLVELSEYEEPANISIVYYIKDYDKKENDETYDFDGEYGYHFETVDFINLKTEPRLSKFAIGDKDLTFTSLKEARKRVLQDIEDDRQWSLGILKKTIKKLKS